jgi:hypothetical protein
MRESKEMMIKNLGSTALVASGEPGEPTQTVILEVHGMQQNVAVAEQQVVSFGAPADAAEAGRHVVERFPKLLGRLAEL